jgi:hypothetical protein
MKKLIVKFYFLLLLLVIAPIFSEACTLYNEPKSKFNPELYIFIGEVIGYTDKSVSKGVIKNGSGLKIKVLESVNLPEKPTNEYFEVFPYDTSSDCRRYIGLSEKYIQENYPFNSKVIIITDEFYKPKKESKVNQLVLLVDPFLRYRIYRNDLKNPASATSTFNYAGREDLYYASFEFEILKDFKRLEDSSSDEEKIEIFNRLVYLPKRLIDFEAAVQNYIKTPEIRQTLINKRKSLKE